jgi:hypothetical protein
MLLNFLSLPQILLTTSSIEVEAGDTPYRLITDDLIIDSRVLGLGSHAPVG